MSSFFSVTNRLGTHEGLTVDYEVSMTTPFCPLVSWDAIAAEIHVDHQCSGPPRHNKALILDDNCFLLVYRSPSNDLRRGRLSVNRYEICVEYHNPVVSRVYYFYQTRASLGGRASSALEYIIYALLESENVRHVTIQGGGFFGQQAPTLDILSVCFSRLLQGCRRVQPSPKNSVRLRHLTLNAELCAMLFQHGSTAIRASLDSCRFHVPTMLQYASAPSCLPLSVPETTNLKVRVLEPSDRERERPDREQLAIVTSRHLRSIRFRRLGFRGMTDVASAIAAVEESELKSLTIERLVNHGFDTSSWDQFWATIAQHGSLRRVDISICGMACDERVIWKPVASAIRANPRLEEVLVLPMRSRWRWEKEIEPLLYYNRFRPRIPSLGADAALLGRALGSVSDSRKMGTPSKIVIKWMMVKQLAAGAGHFNERNGFGTRRRRQRA